MSRHSFDEIISNAEALAKQYDLDNGESEIEEPLCQKGYGLSDWLRDGIVGWDPNLNTYFIQQGEIEEDGCDTLEWWLGTFTKQIPTFDVLCSVINEIFSHKVVFEFVDTISLSPTNACN